MINPFRRTPKFDDMSYDMSMRMLRMFTRTGAANQKTLVALARRAVDVAPTEQERNHALRWLGPLEAGRRIRISTFPMRITHLEGVDVETIDEIDSVEKEMES